MRPPASFHTESQRGGRMDGDVLTGEVLDPEGRGRGIDDLKSLSRLFDSFFEVPFLKWRFGLDALLGLFPALGDTVTSFASLYILGAAMKLGVPRLTLMRMAANVGLDYLVGSIPLVGDLFDVWWKANQRNVALIERHLESAPRRDRRGRIGDWLFLAAIAVVLLALLAGSIAMAVWLLAWLASQLGRQF